MVTLTDRNELFCLFIKYQRFQRAAHLAYFRLLIHITGPRHILDMSHLLLLRKFEYGGGPIFKVVLEC